MTTPYNAENFCKYSIVIVATKELAETCAAENSISECLCSSFDAKLRKPQKISCSWRNQLSTTNHRQKDFLPQSSNHGLVLWLLQATPPPPLSLIISTDFYWKKSVFISIKDSKLSVIMKQFARINLFVDTFLACFVTLIWTFQGLYEQTR